jgi:hypothetical protein
MSSAFYSIIEHAEKNMKVPKAASRNVEMSIITSSTLLRMPTAAELSRDL